MQILAKEIKCLKDIAARVMVLVSRIVIAYRRVHLLHGHRRQRHEEECWNGTWLSQRQSFHVVVLHVYDEQSGLYVQEI
jgi:hypothetical protein